MGVKEDIIKELQKHPQGIIIEALAALVGVTRQTASRYIMELQGADMITVEQFASAKIIKLSEKARP